MSGIMTTDVQLISRIEQFYYREARLLDGRCFQQWLGLLDQRIEYIMPSRHVPLPDIKARDTEAFLSVERELSGYGPADSPFRHERYPQLALRATRPYKVNAWAESPPPRTRRMISNVEVETLDDGAYRVFSNFLMYYSHSGADNHIYTGCRRDLIEETDSVLRIFRREVLTDWDIVTGPTLGLFF